jgi:DNA-binding NarL/FixJ family response regulator/DNA invertase Pin-like site-specific DNA recombinase
MLNRLPHTSAGQLPNAPVLPTTATWPADGASSPALSNSPLPTDVTTTDIANPPQPNGTPLFQTPEALMEHVNSTPSISSLLETTLSRVILVNSNPQHGEPSSLVFNPHENSTMRTSIAPIVAPPLPSISQSANVQAIVHPNGHHNVHLNSQPTNNQPNGRPATHLQWPRNGRRYRVATYERVSRPTEVTGSHSFDTQLPAIIRKLDFVYGEGNYDLVNFSDDGVSGGYGAVPTIGQHRTRRGFALMWEQIRQGQFDAVAAYELSRLYRSGRIHHEFVEDILLPTRTALILATQDIDIFTPEGQMQASLHATFDHNQRSSNGRRLRAAMATRRELGLPLGPPPYGWRRTANGVLGSRTGYEPDPEARDIVLYIRERYLAGANIVTIAGELNDRHVPAPAPRRGRRARTASGIAPLGLWNAESVLKVIEQPCHAGLMYSLPDRGGELIPANHYEQRFYDPADYHALQACRRGRMQNRRTNAARANSPHLLNGLLRCRRCARNLNVAHGSRDAQSGEYNYRFYRCNTGRSQGQRSCPDLTVPAVAAETALAGELARLFADPGLRQMLREEAEQALSQRQRGAGARLEGLQRQLAELEQNRRLSLGRLERGVITEADFVELRQVRESQTRALQNQIEEIGALAQGESRLHQKLARFEAACDQLAERWENMPVDERRAILEQLVESLQADRSGREVILYVRFALGEERQIRLSVQTMRQMQNRQRSGGVLALTPRQLALLFHYGQGRRSGQIAEAMGISLGCVMRCGTDIRQRLGQNDLAVAAAMAQEHIEERRDSLPLGPSFHHRSLNARSSSAPLLSDKMLEVLILLSQGSTQAEIARQLEVSIQVINTRRKRLLNQLGVNNIPDAARLAREAGLME